jgi:hypothetical protein
VLVAGHHGKPGDLVGADQIEDLGALEEVTAVEQRVGSTGQGDAASPAGRL